MRRHLKAPTAELLAWKLQKNINALTSIARYEIGRPPEPNEGLRIRRLNESQQRLEQVLAHPANSGLARWPSLTTRYVDIPACGYDELAQTGVIEVEHRVFTEPGQVSVSHKGTEALQMFVNRTDKLAEALGGPISDRYIEYVANMAVANV